MTPKPEHLVALQFVTDSDFSVNLDKLRSLLESLPINSIALAPEVCLSGFCYDRMDEAARFSESILATLCDYSKTNTFALTLIECDLAGSGYVNRFRVFHNGRCVHTQDKNRLFPLGDEHSHFQAGAQDEIICFDIDGIRCAALVCFELRFLDLWQQVRGADLIFVPAMWGKPRKSHYESLCESLAVMNQCFVIAADSANDDMAKGSGIITPFGHTVRDDSAEMITHPADWDEITKMRRYIDTGLASQHSNREANPCTL